MPEAFLQLLAADQAEILQTCAGKLGRRPEHLEKDVWICWVLQSLFTMPGRLNFAIQPGVSRLENGGMGFATMLRSTAELWGNAHIRSGEAALIIVDAIFAAVAIAAFGHVCKPLFRR